MFGVVEANVNDLGKHVQEPSLDLRISNEKMFSDVRMFSCSSCSSFGHSSRRTGKNPKFVVYRVEKIPQLRKELHTSCISRQARLNEILKPPKLASIPPRSERRGGGGPHGSG